LLSEERCRERTIDKNKGEIRDTLSKRKITLIKNVFFKINIKYADPWHVSE
jgi:hypothetical protein